MKLSKKQQLAYFLENAKFAFKQANADRDRDYHKGQLNGLAMAYFAVSGVRSEEIDGFINQLGLWAYEPGKF